MKYLWWLIRLSFTALIVVMILGTLIHMKENYKRNGTLTYIQDNK